MNNRSHVLKELTDEQLLVEIKALAEREREATASLIASLGELDARRLYLGEGCPSLFVYCTRCLHLSEHAAYGRIEAARAAQRYPLILELLVEGTITLTAVCLLAPHLKPDNHRSVLEATRHKSKREVELQVAALRPLPPVPSSVRKLPTPKSSANVQMEPAGVDIERQSSSASSDRGEADRRAPVSVSRRPVVAPLAPECYKVQFTVTRDTHDKLRLVQDLLRHSVPDGDPAAIFDRALTLLLESLQKQKLAHTGRPRPTSRSHTGSRHVPAAVKREVWARDGGQCAFVGSSGRCGERAFLEFHHVVPFAAGGQTTSANLELRCKSHNRHEADLYFGNRGWSLIREKRVEYGECLSSVRTEDVRKIID